MPPHCAFSSNLFHGQIVQIAILQPSDPENKKCSPWKVFWAGEALEAWMRDCLNITSAQNWHFDIFQISQKKVSRLDKRNFLYLLNKYRGLHTWFLQIITPKIVWKCAGALLSSRKIWKMAECQFWTNVMLRRSHVWASRATPAQKLQILRVV